MTTEHIAEIPCEICNSNVPFNSYIEHVERCFVVSASQNYLQQTIQQSIQHHDQQSQQPMMQTILQLNSLLNSDDEQENESTQIILNSDMFFINNSNNSVTPLSRSANELFNIIPILLGENTIDSYEINLEIQEMTGGNVLVPVKNKEEAYTIIEESDDDEIISNSSSCAICLDKPENKQFVRTTCNHVYCKDCIDKWFEMNSKCPICKKNFNDVESNSSGNDADQEDSYSDCEEENVEQEEVEFVS
jgi:hypothetical protein